MCSLLDHVTTAVTANRASWEAGVGCLGVSLIPSADAWGARLVGRDQVCVHSLGFGAWRLFRCSRSSSLRRAEVVFADHSSSPRRLLRVGYATHPCTPLCDSINRSTLGSRSKGASFWSETAPKSQFQFPPSPNSPQRQLQSTTPPRQRPKSTPTTKDTTPRASQAKGSKGWRPPTATSG